MAIVERLHGVCDPIVRDGLEGLRFWELLTQQPIHVFIGPAFPGGVRMEKEKCDLILFSDLLV